MVDGSEPPPEALTVLLVSSSGGVLLDLMALRPWWIGYDVHWVSVEAADTRELLAGQRVTWEQEISPRHPLELARATVRARALLARLDVGLVVSAGSGVAVPFFLAARAARVPAWWVETLNVLGTPGVASRVGGRLAQQVVVQHGQQLADHPRAVNVGELY